jgi:N-acetylglucosaminyldiphosphoundecaprenol N-acetyl-beta-D-mannosaminyltransferase
MSDCGAGGPRVDGRARPDRVRILDCEIDNLDREGGLDRLLALARGGRPGYAVTPNADHLMLLRRDPGFAAAYRDADLRLADGAPLLWAARLQGTPLREKLSGSDLFPLLCARAAEAGLGVYFLGGRPGAAAAAAVRLAARLPRLRITGTACPPRGFEQDVSQDDAVVSAIRAAAPDLLFVALGAPKQEVWIHRHRERLGVPLAIGIGAGLDFVAGHVRRAPVWMQRNGLEWAWRIGQEPRLWSRYLVRDLPFVLYLLGLLLRRASGLRPAARLESHELSARS